MTTQKRAQAGGETGVNGEWYRGGEFIATSENTIKGRERDERPRDLEREAENARCAARLNAWLEARRTEFADLIAQLTANPCEVPVVPAERWTWMLENGHAGFIPSLGRELFMAGSLSRRQAQCVAKAVMGRQTNRNAEAWDSLVERLSVHFGGV